MSNRNHLIPTPVVTKNGVQTTVHKKQQGNAGSSLPTAAPVAVAENPHERLKHDAINALYDSLDAHPEWDQRDIDPVSDGCWKVMDGYHPETLRNLVHVAATDIGFDVFKMIGYQRETEAFINDWIMFQEVIHNDDLMLKPTTMLRGLVRYEHLAPQTDPERRVEQGTAICRAISHMSFSGLGGIVEGTDGTPVNNRFYYIKDEKLRDLITTHHSPDAVVDLIVERSIIDGEQLTQLVGHMDRTHDALNEGML